MTSPHDPFAPPSQYGRGSSAGGSSNQGPSGNSGWPGGNGGPGGAASGQGYGSAPTPFQGANNPYQGEPAQQGGQTYPAQQGGADPYQAYPNAPYSNPPYSNQPYSNQPHLAQSVPAQSYPGSAYAAPTPAAGQQFGTPYPAGPYAISPHDRPGAASHPGQHGGDAPGPILAAALMTWLGAAVGLVLGLFFVIRAGQVDPLAQWGLRHVTGGQIQVMGGLIAAISILAALLAIGAFKHNKPSAVGLLVLGGIWAIYGIFALVVGSYFYAATTVWVLAACALLLAKLRWYTEDQAFAPEKVLSQY